MKAKTWILAAASVVIWSGHSIAAPRDFSVCDGQAGVALGLCRGGIAAGCGASNGGTEACLAIEENYRQISGGGEPPWVSSGYPINTISVETGVGVDLESGAAGYDARFIKSTDPNFPYCQEQGTCEATDLTAFDWKEQAAESGNPFMFFQHPCTAPTEPGYGGFPEYVVLRDVAFVNVNNSAIDAATFTQATYSQWWWGTLPNLGSNDTLIVHTCAGNYFKVGNQKCNYPDSAESQWPMCKDANLPVYWTQFDYQMLRPAL